MYHLYLGTQVRHRVCMFCPGTVVRSRPSVFGAFSPLCFCQLPVADSTSFCLLSPAFLPSFPPLIHSFILAGVYRRCSQLISSLSRRAVLKRSLVARPFHGLEAV